jgi:hypothetical protein
MGMNEAIEALAAAVERFSTSLAPADLTAMGDALRAYRALPVEVSGEREWLEGLVDLALNEAPLLRDGYRRLSVERIVRDYCLKAPRPPREVSERSEAERLVEVMLALGVRGCDRVVRGASGELSVYLFSVEKSDGGSAERRASIVIDGGETVLGLADRGGVFSASEVSDVAAAVSTAIEFTASPRPLPGTSGERESEVDYRALWHRDVAKGREAIARAEADCRLRDEVIDAIHDSLNVVSLSGRVEGTPQGATVYREVERIRELLRDGAPLAAPLPSRPEVPETLRDWVSRVVCEAYALGRDPVVPVLETLLSRVGPPPVDRSLLEKAMRAALSDPDAYSLIRVVDTAPPSAAVPAKARLAETLSCIATRIISEHERGGR